MELKGIADDERFRAGEFLRLRYMIELAKNKFHAEGVQKGHMQAYKHKQMGSGLAF